MTPTTEWVFLNGQLLPGMEAKVSPLGEGFMFGFALFETMRLIEGKPAFLESHYRRLSGSARALGLECRSTKEEWAREGAQLAERNGQANGILKRVVFRDVAGCGELLTTRPFPYLDSDYARGFRLQTQRDGRVPVGPAHKTTSYLKNVLARRHAKEAGYDDALFVAEEGAIFEGAATNLFVVSKGEILTPVISKAIIPGVARSTILKRWPSRVRQTEVSMEMLKTAGEVFVTNAAIGVMPVSRIDGYEFAVRDDGVTAELRAEFQRWQRERE